MRVLLLCWLLGLVSNFDRADEGNQIGFDCFQSRQFSAAPSDQETLSAGCDSWRGEGRLALLHLAWSQQRGL